MRQKKTNHEIAKTQSFFLYALASSWFAIQLNRSVFEKIPAIAKYVRIHAFSGIDNRISDLNAVGGAVDPDPLDS